MNDYQQPSRYQQQPPAPQQQHYQQPPYHQPPKKRHTGLIVAIVILVVLVLGGLVSCFACGAAVDSAVEGDKASSVTSDGSSQQNADSGDASMSAVALYDGHGITVSATERGEQLGMGYYTIEIKNDSKSNVYVSIEDVSVDGTMADTFFYEDVAAGKTANAELTLTNVDSMDDLKNVEGTVSIVDQDDLSTIGSDSFTIK